MIRILHVISDENVGGAGILLANLLRHLDATRFHSAVALPQDSALIDRLSGLAQIFPLRYPCNRLSVASLRELTEVIRQWKPHLIHGNAALSAKLAGRLHGKAVVYTRHCYYPLEAPRLGLRALAERQGNRWLTDFAIATAPSAAENLRSLRVPQGSLRVILNGSEPVRVCDAEELAAWRWRHGLGEKEILIGICARLEACKGHETFLRAARLLADRMSRCPLRFVIVGEGSRREELEHLARTLALEDRVCFTGFEQDMAPVYRSLRIHVNCSCGTETSCLALSEGMSASLPTVASDYGGNPLMVQAAGRCFPVGNGEALAAVLEEILTVPSLERQMREASLADFRERFTAERMARETQEVYEEVLARRSRKASRRGIDSAPKI